MERKTAGVLIWMKAVVPTIILIIVIFTYTQKEKTIILLKDEEVKIKFI